MLEAAVNGAKLGGLFDTIFSVEEVDIKPHPRGLSARRGPALVPTPEIAFESSNSWNAHATAAFGMQVAWGKRYGQPRDASRRVRPRGDIDHEFAGVQARGLATS
jgi:hypothetical protein